MGYEYVVMVPFMAQGHLIPFLALARLIHRRTGFSVVIANSALNINYLRSTQGLSQGIRFAELAFSGVENTDVLPLSEMDELFHASTALESPFRSLLSDLIAENQGTPPLCVVADVFTGWSVQVARELGAPAVTFCTGGAYGTAAYVSLWLNLPHHNSDSEGSFSVPGFPEQCRFHVSQLHHYIRSADGTDSWSRFMQTQISLAIKSDGWLCNSVKEMEPLGVQILTDFLNLPIWTIGPLLPPEMLGNNKASGSVFRQRTAKAPGISAEKCLEWLSSHEPGSVVYVSFGSQNTIMPRQMKELATGLEGSGKAFIWVIRAPLGFDIKGEFREEWLPEGFEERTAKAGKGLLVREWAPQLEILAHGATGAFVSHCGWNSVVESLSQGVPIIGWPMAGEQAYNLKMLQEELGVAVELARGIHSTVVAEDIMRLVHSVMDGGDEMKRKAAELGENIRAAVREDNGSSVKALDDFVNLITSSRKI